MFTASGRFTLNEYPTIPGTTLIWVSIMPAVTAFTPATGVKTKLQFVLAAFGADNVAAPELAPPSSTTTTVTPRLSFAVPVITIWPPTGTLIVALFTGKVKAVLPNEPSAPGLDGSTM